MKNINLQEWFDNGGYIAYEGFVDDGKGNKTPGWVSMAVCKKDAPDFKVPKPTKDGIWIPIGTK